MIVSMSSTVNIYLENAYLEELLLTCILYVSNTNVTTAMSIQSGVRMHIEAPSITKIWL
jgi:hypothetical protein